MNTTLAASKVETIVTRNKNNSEDLLHRLEAISTRLQDVLDRAGGAGPESDSSTAQAPRSSGLFYYTADVLAEAHNVADRIVDQLGRIDDLI